MLESQGTARTCPGLVYCSTAPSLNRTQEVKRSRKFRGKYSSKQENEIQAIEDGRHELTNRLMKQSLGGTLVRTGKGS
jgi:alpha-beta hydrolase superfamily lysophospholipase